MKNTGINAIITFLAAAGASLVVGALGLISVSLIAAVIIGVVALLISALLNLLIAASNIKPKQRFVDLPIDDGEH